MVTTDSDREKDKAELENRILQLIKDYEKKNNDRVINLTYHVTEDNPAYHLRTYKDTK